VIVCDVNETLLDIGALAPLFEQAFGDGRVLQEWFHTVLLYSEVATLAGPYSRGVTLTTTGRDRILKGMLTLPPHPDVREGLETLRDASLRLVTLTNNPPETVHQQLAHAGLAELFEHTFSVESVRRFKPAPEVYRFVADTLGVTTTQLRLVAAHAWDVLGALRVGCAAAFVARPGKALFPLGPQPDIVGPDFRAVARQIVNAEAASLPRKGF
jgi:2-haloacid dehalogenase